MNNECTKNGTFGILAKNLDYSAIKNATPQCLVSFQRDKGNRLCRAFSFILVKRLRKERWKDTAPWTRKLVWPPEHVYSRFTSTNFACRVLVNCG